MTMRNTDFKELVEDSIEGVKQFQAKYDVRHSELQAESDELRSRVEAIEAKQSNPSLSTYSGETREQHEHKKLFESWVRKPHDSERNRKLSEFEANSTKAASIGSAAGGGYAVPELLLSEIERFERKFSPMRDLVRVINISSGDARFLVDIGGTTNGWVAEGDSRTATNTPQLREVVPTGGEIYSYVSATEWLVDDASFNIGSWLSESIAEGFSVSEGQAIVSGNGSSKPTGFLNLHPLALRTMRFLRELPLHFNLF